MRSFFSELFGLAKKHPVMLLLFFVVLVVFAATPFVWLWRKAVAVVRKVSPRAADALPKGGAALALVTAGATALATSGWLATGAHLTQLV